MFTRFSVRLSALGVIFAIFSVVPPAQAGTCVPYGCGGQVYNMNPDYGANAFSVKVTYDYNKNDATVMNKWAKQVAPQRDAGCHTLVGEALRCDVDGVYTPSGFNIYCYTPTGSLQELDALAKPFVATGWHKIVDNWNLDCQRLPE